MEYMVMFFLGMIFGVITWEYLKIQWKHRKSKKSPPPPPLY